MTANRPGWSLLSRRENLSSKASDIYGRLVAQARSVPFYAEQGVSDTPEGRTELILLHVVLVLRRLGRDGDPAAPLARALTETFVTDMDDCMREMGVGDLMVAKRVKKAAAGLFDRLRDYGAALATADTAALARLIEHNILMQETPGAAPAPGAHRIAAYAIEAEQELAAAASETLATAPAFPPAPQRTT